MVDTYVGKTRLRLLQGDITQQDTEAIVNAANSSLMGGGGVDGAIHRAGGPQILEECKEIVARQGRLPTGEAVITGGGRLPARYVIHTVGPIWQDGQHGEPELLCNAYFNSLALAKKHGIRSLSFPSISTGAYRFPIDQAARIALTTVRDFLQEHEFAEVRFVLFSEKDLRIYEEAWEEVSSSK
ncbi:MAG: O-acetyl-ADP-ribose deacetylase [Bacillota bacterium]